MSQFSKTKSRRILRDLSIEEEGWRLIQGDASHVLRCFEDETFDAMVTDPPAGISFMGKEWDGNKGGRDGWVRTFAAIFSECLRVLKPGGHTLVWALPRTSHWTATALEDAGFEVRDVLTHHQGQGFPKSLDVSKAIDKAVGAKRKFVIGERDGYVRKPRAMAPGGATRTAVRTMSTPVTPAAHEWEGWGTALKPASEHWILARRPLVGTVAANVLEHRTGALNVDGCRVGTTGATTRGDTSKNRLSPQGAFTTGHKVEKVNAGRWPPNLLLTHSAECGDECAPGCPVAEMDQQSGILQADRHHAGFYGNAGTGIWGNAGAAEFTGRKDVPGGASRFFPRFRYAAKASSKERNAGLPDGQRSSHPTVKSLALMQWLCRLVTPTGGKVLDPFAGSGSTGVAALVEDFEFTGIEREEEYVEIAAARLREAEKK